MGLDLTLLPDTWEYPADDFLAVTKIDTKRDLRIYRQIRGSGQIYEGLDADATVRVGRFDRPVRFYGDEGLKKIETDAYGNPLTFAFAGALAAMELPSDCAPTNRAAWAYLAALPPLTQVVLYWN